jgi:putative protease
LLSGYFNRRDAEQGLTKDAHRSQAIDNREISAIPLGQDFDFTKEQQDAENAFAACGGVRRHPLADKVYLLEELERPGQLMPVMEDEHGTYIMNSKDLRAVEYIERLVKMGVDALKIEGRTKSLYYVARTAQIYRRAIDDAVAGRLFDPELIAQLESLAHRGYTSGFLERRPSYDYQAYERGGAQAQHSQYVGQVLRVVEGWAEVELKDSLSIGDTLEIMHPSGNRLIQLSAMRDEQGQTLALATAQTAKIWVFMADQEAHVCGALLSKML